MKKIICFFKVLSRVLKVRVVVCTLILAAIFNPIVAQSLAEMTNPKVAVSIVHPPNIGVEFDKVIFNTISGNCADQVTSKLMSTFIEYGVEVVDKQTITSILATKDIVFTGYIDKDIAVSIGEIIGPSAMLTIRVLKCQAESKAKLYRDEKKQNKQTKEKYTERVYFAKTSYNLNVSLQVVDLSSGKIFKTQLLEYTPTLENTSLERHPKPPSETDALEKALKALNYDVYKMFFPRKEKIELTFYDDKKGGLKDAYKALEAGDKNEAYRLSKKSLKFCIESPDIKEKTLAHAYYNLGVIYFLAKKYNKALENFRESDEWWEDQIFTDAIEECKRAKDLEERYQKIKDNAAFEAEKFRNKAGTVE